MSNWHKRRGTHHIGMASFRPISMPVNCRYQFSQVHSSNTRLVRFVVSKMQVHCNQRTIQQWLQPMPHRIVTFKHQAQIVTWSVSFRGNFYAEYPMMKTSSDVTFHTLSQSLNIRQADTASCLFTPYPYSVTVLRQVCKAHCTAAIADTYYWQISVNNCSPQHSAIRHENR